MSGGVDFNSLFYRLQNLSLTSSLPATLPDISYYDYLASSSDSQFIYFTRLTRPLPSSSGTEDQAYYIPFFTDNFHTLLHEIANYYELPNGVADILGLSVKAEGTESDGKFAELELGLDGIKEENGWEVAKKRLGEMGFGNKVPEGGVQMGEAVVVVVEV